MKIEIVKKNKLLAKFDKIEQLFKDLIYLRKKYGLPDERLLGNIDIDYKLEPRNGKYGFVGYESTGRKINLQLDINY